MTPRSLASSPSVAELVAPGSVAAHDNKDEINIKTDRTTIFISKGTPEDDDFVLWLAPRLEAQGYKIFADILSLEPGDRWRREITNTLQIKATKMLLCCRDVTLTKNGVQEEIGIAEDLAKELNDPRFIIPLRLEKFKKLFGIGELQYANFEDRWANGLIELLETLATQNVPCDPGRIEINPNWESYKKRHAIQIENAPERLTSNWLRIIEVPDTIRYFQPTGAINHQALHQECRDFHYPAEVYHRGFFSFCDLDEINDAFHRVGNFALMSEIPFMEFVGQGAESPSIRSRAASNLAVSMIRQAWEIFCRERNFQEYFYSQLSGFHVTDEHVPLGKRLRWGRQGENRSSMLLNKAQGKIWQFGVNALPGFWPFPHLKLKSRVLFAEADGDKVGSIFDNKNLQHRFRRRVCKGWRNKQWHGRLMAFMELLAGDDSSVKLPLGPATFVKLDAAPIIFTSAVTTILPNVMDDEDEEQDDDTLTSTLHEEDDD